MRTARRVGWGIGIRNVHANVREALYVKVNAEVEDFSVHISPMKRPVTFPPESVLVVAISLPGL